MEKDKRVLLTISLLVSNRKDTIRKCMESLKPLLEAVPSELIAIDTVGEENSDGSLAIVKEYTDKIIRFEWCNDFAAARNAGLMQAKGEWFLFIDDDEWFEDTMPIQMFFLEGDYKNYDRAWYYVRNYQDFAGMNYIDTLADRMCKITPETRFVGRVHECIAPQGTKVMQFFCYAHHYGYVYKNMEERRKHFERNCSLLEIEVKEHPDDPRMLGQLLQEYMADKCYEEAIGCASKWLEEHEEKSENPFSQYIVLTWLRAVIEAEDIEKAEELACELSRKYSLKEIPKAAFLVEWIRLFMKMKNYEGVLEKAEEYFELAKIIRKKGAELLEQQVFELKDTISQKRVEEINECVICAALKCGKNDVAKKYLSQVVWNDENNKPFGVMMQLAESYGETGNGELFFPYAEQILNNSQMKKPFLVAVEGLVRDYPERKDNVVAWLSERVNKDKQAERKTINPEMQKLAEQLKENIKMLIAAGNIAEAKELIDGLKEIVPWDEEIVELEQECKKKGV